MLYLKKKSALAEVPSTNWSVNLRHVCDQAALENAVDEYKVTHIAHLAALMPEPAEANPRLAVRVSFDGIINVLEVARAKGIKRVVYTSSKAAYGEINGEEGKTRKDYQPSEDDNVLVQGVEGDKGALGYFGFSYYEQNQDKLNLVGVDAGSGCVKPSRETVQAGDYKPLSRPIYMYPSTKALAKPEVKAFMEFVVTNQKAIADAAGFVSMTDQQAADSKAEVDRLAGIQ